MSKWVWFWTAFYIGFSALTSLTLLPVVAFARSSAGDLSIRNVKMKSAEVWLQQESQVAQARLLANISGPGTVTGTVVASPQTQGPNYYRHWVRDAALTMDVVFQLSQKNPKLASALNLRMQDYAALSRQNQLANTRAGLGEPIFEVDGSPFVGPWGRPQNDGPALRAIVLSQWAQSLLDRGEVQYVRQFLYAPQIPANTLIKADLEYVSHHWAEPCFDLWEEVKARHFYTQMVQRKALVLGAQLARRMGDPRAAQWYESQAAAVESSLLRFRSEKPGKQGLILASLDWTEGLSAKSSNLDTAVILGVLHGHLDLKSVRMNSFVDPLVMNTLTKLNQTFASLYSINRRNSPWAPALGRYPEDVYSGTDFNGGNPWVLTTLAAAEYSYAVAGELASGSPEQAKIWFDQGDSYVQRVQFHANPDGSLSEQMDRNSGYMTSARDLTWNYAAVLTTSWQREQVVGRVSQLKTRVKIKTEPKAEKK